MSNCIHKWKRHSHSIKRIWENCELCDKKRERDTTVEEAKKLKKEIKKEIERVAKLHAVWHDFSQNFIGDGAKFTDKGYSLSKKVKVWAKNHPTVKITSCDDSLHMTSSLVIIPHEFEDEYWGTTIVYIPQAGDPSEIFLYPGHMTQLIKALWPIHNRCNKKGWRYK